MTTATDFVTLLESQDGDQYIFGHEVNLSDTNPDAFDCSELVQWGCHQLGVHPTMPDGSWYQVTHCRAYETLVTVDEAIATAGALLFRFSSTPFTGTRPTSAHVAVSRGDGTTIEARGTAYGVGIFSAHNRGWTHAAQVPGINYQGDEVLTAEEIKVVQDLTAALESVESNGWFAKFLVPKFREWNAAGGPTTAELADLYEQIGQLRTQIETPPVVEPGTKLTVVVE